MDSLVSPLLGFVRDNPVCVAAFFVAGVCYYLSHFLSKLVPAYNTLTPGGQAEWCSRVVSNIHAVIVTYGSLRILSSDVYDKYPYTAWSEEGRFYANILLGYFLYDLILCLSYKQLRTVGTLFHHCLGLFYYTVVNVSGHAQYLAMLWLASELTTPFVNMRWFLFVMKKTDTTLYLVNGMLMTLGFLLWRVIYIPGSALYTLYYFSDHIKLTAPYVQPLIPISMPSITILNAYWTYLMIKGILKFIKPGGKKEPRQKAA